MEYAHMIDFTYLNYALRETMGLFLKFLTLLKPVLSGDLYSVVVASDKVDEVSNMPPYPRCWRAFSAPITYSSVAYYLFTLSYWRGGDGLEKHKQNGVFCSTQL